MTLKSHLPKDVLLFTTWVPWTGDPKRVSRVNYDQTSPEVINAQLDAMQDSGIDGIIAVWQGPFRNPYTHAAWLSMLHACIRRKIPMFTMFDQWVAKTLAPAGSTPEATVLIQTQAVIDALKHPWFQVSMWHAPEPWVFEFDLTASAKVDLAKVRAAVAGLEILSWHKDYSWPEPKADLGKLAWYEPLERDNLIPTMKFPAVFMGFDDGGYPLPAGVGAPALWNGQRDWNKSVWGGGDARRIDSRAGQTFIDSCALVPAGAKFANLVSWNDYDEGTAVEGWCSAVSGVRIG